MSSVCKVYLRPGRLAILAAWGLLVPSAAAQSTDLSISRLVLHTATPVPGEPVAIEVVVHSTAACTSCDEVQVSYWNDSADGDVSCADGRSIWGPMLTAAGSETVVQVVLDGYPRPGTYRAWFWVNCEQEIAEQDSSNNMGYVDILVYAPDSVPAPPLDEPVDPDPVDPTDPTDPADPTDPSDPSDPDPTDPTDPSDPVDPPDPVDPTDPVDPGGHDPTNPADQPIPNDPGSPTDETPGNPGPVDEQNDPPPRAGVGCGLLGAQSVAGVMGLLGTIVLGLIGMKHRRRW